MKKILLFLLILPLVGLAQTKTIDGFWGIKFGSTKAATDAAMKAKGCKSSTLAVTDDMLAYDDVTFAQRKAFFVILKFYKNQFYEATVTYKPDPDMVINQFEKMATELKSSYGETTVFHNFTKPYELGDGYELSAIKQGKADYAAYWSTANSDGNKNFISLDISKDLYVDLTYQDGTIIKKAIAEKDKLKANDY